jgi:uncharacterized membrane protein YGL010W
MNKRIDHLFADYASHHRTRGNKICHRVGIPVIMFSLLGLLQRVVLWHGRPRVDAAMLLIALATVTYVVWSARLAAVMLPVSVLMYLGALLLPLPVHIALFVGGWILQFVGHARYEKQSPAFLNNLLHLLVGPLWILEDVTHLEGGKTMRNA